VNDADSAAGVDGRGSVDGLDDEAIRGAIERARRLSDGEAEPYRSLAFRAVLEHLLRGAPAATIGAPAPAASPPSLEMDLTEFLAAKKATTHPDRVVAIAYYVYRTQNGAGVTTQDLTDAYSRARVKKPQNFPDVIAACVRRGRLVEGERKDGMKSWVITRTGEAYVEQNL
jgi:hypothetical protein